MDLLSPLRLGVHVATDAVKLATIVPRLILHQLKSDDGHQRFEPTERPAGARPAPAPPDPTAASSTTPARRTVRQGERRSVDVQPPTTRARTRTEPTRSEVDRRRAEQRESVESPEATLAETEGAAAPSAALRVDEPWDGYGSMKASVIVTRVKAADEATKAVVRLYEQTHKNRKSVLDATGS